MERNINLGFCELGNLRHSLPTWGDSIPEVILCPLRLHGMAYPNKCEECEYYRPYYTLRFPKKEGS